MLRLAIGAIFKNEGPYILEWVAFHRALGVDRFFIADNNSNDGATELLLALESLGIVDRIPFPHLPGEPPQMPAYAEIMRRFGSEADWVAFIDADEFLMPTDGARSIRPVFEAMQSDVGAVAVNWAIYGSSSRREPSTGPVIERFSWRADDDFAQNHHYKTVVRTERYVGPGGNPHQFRIAPSSRLAHADGLSLSDHPVRGGGLSEHIHWQPLRLNHYVVKSRAEFDRKKTPRGSATVLSRIKGGRYFANLDRNEVSDPMPDWLMASTREEIKRIRRELREAGCNERIVHLDHTIATLTPLSLTGAKGGQGFVDRITVDGGKLRIVGWALGSELEPIPRFSLQVGDFHLRNINFNRIHRPDVSRKFSGADINSGFSISLPLSELPDEALSAPLIGVISEEPLFSLGMPETVAWPPQIAQNLLDIRNALARRTRVITGPDGGSNAGNIETISFICGCGHSGTTLLANMFAAHPGAYVPLIETNTFINKVPSLDKFSELVIDAIHDGKNHFLEKTPKHIIALDTIRGILPSAKFILMVRDGRDVAASFLKRFGVVDSGLKRWVSDNKLVAKEKDADDVIIVRYESLIENPQSELEKVCRFIGMPFSPSMLEYHKVERRWFRQEKTEKGTGQDGSGHDALRNWQVNQPIFNGRGAWKNILSEDQVDLFKQGEPRELMELFGYTF